MPSTPSPPLAKGAHAGPAKSDLRSPCPMVNTLANHGYIPRDGRMVHNHELSAALAHAGLSPGLIALLVNPVFLETAASQPAGRSLWQKALAVLRNPWLLFQNAGFRRPGEVDAMGRPCIDLDQLAQHGIIEHDISLSRHDLAQGDNHSPQPELVDELLRASSDGGKTLSIADLAAVRRRRMATQAELNPGLTYGKFQHVCACMESALLLHVFGDGQRVRTDYLRAFFQDERLPIEEGWRKRGWLRTLGLLELGLGARRYAKVMGLKL